MFFFVIFAGFLVSTHAALFLTPPTNAWARLGEKNVSLVCKASEKIRSCSWETPYGKTYPLEAGLSAEGGRLLHYAVDPGLECGVLISEVQKNDEGRWRCNVAVVENKEVSSAQGMANLSIAIPPEGVSLNAPFTSGSVNISAGTVSSVKCTATNTRPSPVFTWKIGGMPVAGKTMDEEQFVDTAGLSTFSQTLKYKALPEHSNKTLSCCLSHPGLQANVTLNVTVLVIGTDFVSGEFSGLPTGGIVGIAIAVAVIITILVLFAILYRGKCAKNNTEESAEKIKITTEGEENEDDATAAKPNQVLETSTEATKPETFQHFKFITFLPKFRKTEKNLDETSAPEFEKVELNDESEKTDKEKGVENEKEKVRIIPKVRSLISKLKMAPRAKKEDVEMGETESKEEDKDEVDEEIMKELEPEDKEEKEKDEKKVVGSETPV